jgi:hypothetical protein
MCQEIARTVHSRQTTATKEVALIFQAVVILVSTLIAIPQTLTSLPSRGSLGKKMRQNSKSLSGVMCHRGNSIIIRQR